MHRIRHSTRTWIALAVWGTGLILFFALAWWNLTSSRSDADNRLISEAGRTAAQIAALLTLPGGKLDEAGIKAIIMAAMEDDSIYAIKIETRNGLLEGQRRNFLWEPISWDDEIAEDCVQGMTPIRVEGRPEGMVEVWLSPRLSAEEDTLLTQRERLRFILISFLWTCALALLFWYWGDFKRWQKVFSTRSASGETTAKIMAGLGKSESAPDQEASPKETSLVDARAGRDFQRKNPDAWLVTAGMFRQTFGRAPALISRLYAEGAIAGLCHLGRMLEQAAPCIGAKPLAEAARKMQAALNDPACTTRASAVEECAAILDNTLAALSGNQQWSKKAGS